MIRTIVTGTSVPAIAIFATRQKGMKMKLIDADALPREKMLAARGNGQYEDVDIVYGSDIDNAPTIDAVPMGDYMELHNHFVNWQPVRHGKWVVAGKTTHYYTCSICGKPGDGYDNYCRSCGAKMERPCDKCQEWDCYGCDYKQTERSK